MKQFLLTMAGVFAGLALFFIGVPLAILFFIGVAQRPAPTGGAGVLSLDLRKPLTDQEPSSPLAALTSRSLAVTSIVTALRQAETDGAVKALFVRLPEGGIAPGEADELRAAFLRFKAAGKPIIVHSQGLYASGAVTASYMLGAAGSEFWMQPGAPFQATGLATQDFFFKRLFDKYQVNPQFEQRYQYKTAINGFLYDDYTPAQREEDSSWMGSIYASNLAAAAAERGRSVASVQAALEAGPYDAAGAQAHGLIDRLGQVREAEDAALHEAGDGAKLVDMADYIGGHQTSGGVSDPVVAVINAEGDIMTGPSSDGFGSQNINSDDVDEALHTAADDDSVKAIVLRVNSPGGSDTASEQILAAVRAAKAKKPVVVSMGTYGASGGYWISSHASAIVAEPTTLTGSIGVFGGKFAIDQALAHFGVDLRQLSVGGAYAGSDGGQAFTPPQRAAFAADIDRAYATFIGSVAEGRHLPVARVDAIAKGRVWTGAQALQLGLVDQLGGLYDAVDKAEALAGLSGPVRLKIVSAHKSALAALSALFGGGQSALHALATVSAVLSDPQARAALDALDQARLRAEGAVALAPLPQF